MSLRASRTQTSGDSVVLPDSLALSFPVLHSFSDLCENAVLVGFVKASSARGVYVWLGRRVQAFVRVADLSDGFIKDVAQVRCQKMHFRDIGFELCAFILLVTLSQCFLQAFPVGQLVLGRVCALNPAQQQCQLTLKKSVVLPKSAQIKFEALQVGQVLTARVHRVESYGVFVDIEVCARSRCVLLCHGDLNDLASHVNFVDCPPIHTHILRFSSTALAASCPCASFRNH